MLEDLLDEFSRLLKGGVHGVTFLPEEFPGSDEWSWMLELPADDVGPLVKLQWQVPVRSHPLRVSWIHDGFRCWSDGNLLLKLGLSRFRYPSNLWRKARNMVLLFIKGSL